MSDAPAFFRAIEADPDDDTPRLVYADWLDEYAQTDADRARAEFIRVQCESARATGDRRSVLLSREHELLAAYDAVWRTTLPGRVLRPVYVRGFPDPVEIYGRDFAPHAQAISERTPLHHLNLHRTRGVMPAVAACPQLALVRRLSLANSHARNADMTAFAVSPHLVNLRSLDLSQNKIGVPGATDLAAACVPQLRELKLERTSVTDTGLLAVAQADWPALESLDASECRLTSAGVVAFSESPLAPRLASLDLSDNTAVTPAAWVRLARAPLARLKRLDLNAAAPSCVIDEVAETLAANPALEGLRVLHLAMVNLTDRGARAILDSPHLRGLTHLWLSENGLHAATLDRLREAFGAALNSATPDPL